MSDSRDFAPPTPSPPSSDRTPSLNTTRPTAFRPSLDPIASSSNVIPSVSADGTYNTRARSEPQLGSNDSTRAEDLNAHGTLPRTTDSVTASPNPPSYPSIRTRSNTARPNNPTLMSPIANQPSRLRRAQTSFISGRERRDSEASSTGASFFHRPKRSATVRTYHQPTGTHWEPGAEPGIDTSADADDGLLHRLHERCDITVVDFSDQPGHYQEYELSNDPKDNTFKAFMEQSRPEWASCRWICINGLSGDVIKVLGNDKSLHRLAIEDLMDTRSRTKADWYSDHCYMVLTLQKLVWLHVDKEASEDSDSEEFTGNEFRSRKRRKPNLWQRMFPTSHKKQKPRPMSDGESVDQPGLVHAHSSTEPNDPIRPIKTLQRYHGANRARIEYMEDHSALAHEGQAVSVEQVSLFLTEDNTVISFFEHSAPDILSPITARLRSEETILRRSSDASFLVQAIIDAIIDLAMFVAAAYDDAIGRLEFDVLMDPDMSQPRQLYILASEITLLKNTIMPISSLVHALRDHRADASSSNPNKVTGPGAKPRHAVASTVEFSSLSHTYLGDVEDHCLTLTANLEQLTASAEQLTNLIFNTMSAYQNESMKQLTLVTIFFLPLTFLTGYFGQNFHSMYSVDKHTDVFFWYIAIPVQLIVTIYLMRGMITRAFRRTEVKLWLKRRDRESRLSRVSYRQGLHETRMRVGKGSEHAKPIGVANGQF